MKKKILVSTIFILTFKVVLAQWNNSIYLNTNIPMVGAGYFHDVNFISEGSGMCSYSHYYSPSSGTAVWVKSTNDSGNTWGTVWFDNQRSISSYAIHTVKSQNTFYHIKNWQGFTKVDKTINNGLTWNYDVLGSNGSYQDFSAIDTSHLFLLYQNSSYSGTKYFINKYVNGVVSSKIDSFYTEKAHLMFFTNADTGYIATSTTKNENNHFIYKSTTGGTNWVKVFSDSLMNIHKMFFTSVNIGYAVGDSGKIIKTIDGGFNWQYLNTNITLNLKSTFFLNDTIGYVAGDSGLIIKTINGGISWIQQNTGTVTGFSKIFFVNDSIGFALTGQTLYKTNQNPLSGKWEIVPLNRDDILTYPNPFSTQTTLQTATPLQNASLTICNSAGQIVKQIKNISGQTVVFFRDNLPSGLYFLRLTENNKVFSVDKLVIVDN